MDIASDFKVSIDDHVVTDILHYMESVTYYVKSGKHFISVSLSKSNIPILTEYCHLDRNMKIEIVPGLISNIKIKYSYDV